MATYSVGTVEICESKWVLTSLVRGLRVAYDFEVEYQMCHAANKKLHPELKRSA